MSKLKWYAVNSIVIGDIRPIQRKAGGGVTEDMLTDSKNEAIDQCVIYLRQCIAKAEKRIKWLECKKQRRLRYE